MFIAVCLSYKHELERPRAGHIRAPPPSRRAGADYGNLEKLMRAFMSHMRMCNQNHQNHHHVDSPADPSTRLSRG
jgi:hypothetical protein